MVFNIILQSDEEDLLIIEKVSNYLLEIFLDYYAEEDKNIKNNKNNEDKVEKHNKNKNNEEEDSNLEIYFRGEDNSNDEDSDTLYFEEFFPRKKIKSKKRNYIDVFREDNELKKLYDSLTLEFA